MPTDTPLLSERRPTHQFLSRKLQIHRYHHTCRNHVRSTGCALVTERFDGKWDVGGHAYSGIGSTDGSTGEHTRVRCIDHA